MELFKRRYLCFIAFIFIFSAFLFAFVSGVVKIAAFGAALAGLATIIVLFKKNKMSKFRMLFGVFLCISLLLSSMCSYLFITRAENNADSMVGMNTVMVKVISRESDDSYDVRILRLGDREVDERAELVISSDESFAYGDELIIKAKVRRSYNTFDRSRLLLVTAYTDNVGIYLNRPEEISYFSVDGLRALCASMRDSFGEFVDGAFDDYSGIVKGLLVNDKSDIDTKTNLNFRRSGTLHILAVSGMHIALLMGALEILLRKLSVKKEVRIVLVSLFAIFFLVLTAFAASAVRSVIMLYAVYLMYLLSEENDPITSLFVSIALIILISPYSVYDLGMWMSFLATLGILSVYSYFNDLMPYPKQENRLVRYSLRFLISAAKAVMLTVVANFFLLPIMWMFFGEISISAIPCNLVLGPVVAVLMPLCAVSALLSPIPILGDVFVFATKRLIDVMMAIVEFFSEMRFGVVSLSYVFAGIIIVAFSVVMIIMLVIKLKRKALIFAPIVGFAVAFVTCFSIFTLTSEAEIKYVKEDKGEFIFVNKGAECSIINVNSGSVYDAVIIADNMSKYATEIDNYFILNPSKFDLITFNKMLENTIIRNVYIPKDFDYKEAIEYKELIESAEKYNINIELFEIKEIVEIYNGVLFSKIDENKTTVISDDAHIEIWGDKLFYIYDDERREIVKKDELSVALPFE